MNKSLFPQPRNDYPEEFERFWESYPRRPGNPKRAAFRQWQLRQRDGHSADEMIAGARVYAAYCEASGSERTPFVLMARTFLGPDCHFLEEWELPTKPPEWSKLPSDDEKLWDFAKANGFPNPGSMNYFQYRRFLQNKIDERLKQEREG